MKNRIALCAVLAIALCETVPAAAQQEAAFQPRLDALMQQIDLRYGHSTAAIGVYKDQIRDVLADWNRVVGDEASQPNKRLLNAWLDASMRAVMPGGSGALPATPRFEEQSKPVYTLPAPTERSAIQRPNELTPAGETTPLAVDNLPVVDSTEVAPRGSADDTPTTTPWRREVAKPVADDATIARPRGAPSRSKWSRHPSAAPLEWRDPFVDDPSANPNPLRSGTRRSSRRPAIGRTTAVSVNRPQLAAEVRGYRSALRELQLEVIDLESDDLLGLADAAKRLEQLAEQRQFLELYREGLSVSERGWLPESPSTDLVRELLRRKVNQLAEQSPSLERTRRTELERLAARLARLASQSER